MIYLVAIAFIIGLAIGICVEFVWNYRRTQLHILTIADSLSAINKTQRAIVQIIELDNGFGLKEEEEQ